MRALLTAFGLIALTSTLASAQTVTALGALKLLPKEDSKRLARIEAREGVPDPQRWYLLVHDPADENGLREYVVAGTALVASRALSQFAERITAEDVIGDLLVKVDSDRAGKLAQQYAQANNLTVGGYNYELARNVDGIAPHWKVTCLDQSGRKLGEVVVGAGRGNVLSHEGFATEPAELKAKPSVSKPAIVKAEPLKPKRPKPREPEPRPEPVAAPALEPNPPSAVRKVGSSLQRLFGGGR